MGFLRSDPGRLQNHRGRFVFPEKNKTDKNFRFICRGQNPDYCLKPLSGYFLSYDGCFSFNLSAQNIERVY